MLSEWMNGSTCGRTNTWLGAWIGRSRRSVRVVATVLGAVTLMAAAPVHATDVFGVPDEAAPQQQSTTPSHALPLPDGVRQEIGKVLMLQGEMNDAMQTRVADLQTLATPSSGGSPSRGWLTLIELIGLCAGYGVLHALAPGHGKFVVASQFATRRARSREVVSLSLRIALGQSLTAIVLVGAVALFSRAALHGATSGTTGGAMSGAGPLELISNIALVLVGLVAVFRIATGRDCCTTDTPLQFARERSGGSGNDEANDESSGEQYLGAALGSAFRSGVGSGSGSALRSESSSASAPLPAVAGRSNTRRVLAFSSGTPYRGVRGLGLATALRPCAGALFVLLVASTCHVFWAGALAALSIGLGVAATIGVIGLGAASTTAFMLTRPSLRRVFERAQRGLALSGAVLIVLFGLLQIGLLATGVVVLGPG